MADVVAAGKVVRRRHAMAPGGVFHILDDHPVRWLFDTDAADARPDDEAGSVLEVSARTCRTSVRWPARRQ